MYGQISYWAFRDGLNGQRNLLEAMTLAKEAGFAGIELCIGAAGALTPDTKASDCHNLAAAAKAMGLKLHSVASGLLWECNPASARKKVRDEALEVTRKCLRVTADLGAKVLLALPGMVDVFFNPQAEVVPYDQCYERAIVFGKAAATAAKKVKVTACFENAWSKFLLSPLEFAAFIDKVNSPAAGVYFDVGNAWSLGYPQHWIKILGKRIRCVRVKDFKRAAGNVSGFCNLLDGDVPLAESLKLIRKQGYKGPVTAEVFPGPNDLDEPAFLKTVCERMNSILP